MTNYLLSIANGGFGIIGGEEYQRSSNFANPLPAATAAGAIATSSGGLAFGTNAMGAIVSLTLPGTFQYLLVAYDGPNGGAIVYNIADLAAGTVIELARNAEPHDIGDGIASQVLIESSRYQMTGWTLLNPTQTTVPEGGLTLMMLGSGLSGLAVLRRFLKP